MAIRWDKLTLKSQEAVQKASELASENGNPELLPIHLLAALLEDQEGIVIPVLRRIGVGPEKLLSDCSKVPEQRTTRSCRRSRKCADHRK